MVNGTQYDVDWRVLKSNADAERAQLNKILADIREKLYSNTGYSSGMTGANQTVTASINDQLNAMAEAWRNTTARINVMGDDVQVIAEDVLYLNSSVFDPETGLEATASALEVVRTEVDTLNDTVLAMYSLELDVNGYIVGWRFTNDGSTGIADFRADRFRITAPGSMNSFEVRDGLIDSSSSTHSLYQGVNFGVNSDLIMWYGPTPPAQEDGASKSNGLFYIGNNGLPHFGGTLDNDRVSELPIVEKHETSLNLLGVKNGAGSAFILDQDTVRLSANESLSQRLTSINSAIEGKASASAFTALDTYVKQDVDGRITAQGTQLSGLSASVGDNEASINELREVQAGSSVVDLRNPNFEIDSGWGANASGTGALPSSVAYWAGGGRTGRSLRFGSGSGERVAFNAGRFPVRAGERFRMGFFSQTQGAPPAGTLFIAGLRYYDAAGSFLATTNIAVRTATGTTWLYSSGFTDGIGTVPPGAATAQAYLLATEFLAGAVHFDDVFLQRISLTEELMLARYTLAVQAGGDVAGMQLLAGGGISAIRFLADSFSIVAPGGGARTEFSNGNWRVYDSAGNLVVRMGVW